MSRVFVVHETLDRNGARTKNLKPAKEFGELVHLVPSGLQPDDLRGLIPIMSKALASFTEADYLLPIGSPVLIGWATALAARQTCGFVKILDWDCGKYRVVEVENLFQNQEKTNG